MFKARSAFILACACIAVAAFAVPASAQVASITVDQDCIEQGTPTTGGGLVSGSFTGAPTGSQYYTEFAISADKEAGEDWHHYGVDMADNLDGQGNGTFSFNLALYYADLPDTLWISGRYYDFNVGQWLLFAETEVAVCGREDPTPTPEPEPIYDFDGFFQPVENRDAGGVLILNRIEAGSAVPLKFRLGGDYGLDVFEAGFPKSETIACDSQAEVNGVDETVNAGSSGLQYDAATGIYTYVWKTDRSWEDTCRQLVVKFDDGQTARANFLLK